jgi:hypothetical protein
MRRYSQRLEELNSRIGQCVSDLTLHLQLHGLQRADDGLQQLHASVQNLHAAPAGLLPSADHNAQATNCNIDRDALSIDFDFSGQRRLVCSLSDGALLCGRYDGSPVRVLEASAAAVQRVLQLQQQGAGPSLPRLLRDLTNLVHPNVVEIKGGFIAHAQSTSSSTSTSSSPSTAPPLTPKFTVVYEPFDQLLSAALTSQLSSSDMLCASIGICKGLAYMQSLSRRFLLEPDRVTVTRSVEPPSLTCKLLPSIACDAAICRWSPPEHADGAWDGLASPAAVMFSFGLLLLHIWDPDPHRMGPFPMKAPADIRSRAPPPSAKRFSTASLTRCP